jgi:hypothetical protein
MTKATKRKVVHAAMVAVAAAMGDMSLQLASGKVDWTRTAILAAALGVFSRVLGAAMATLVAEEDDDAAAS